MKEGYVRRKVINEGRLLFLPTCVPTLLSSYLSTFVPLYLLTFVPSYLPTFLPSCLPAFLPSCLPAFLLSRLPAFLSFYLVTFLRFYRPSFYRRVYPYLPSFFTHALSRHGREGASSHDAAAPCPVLWRQQGPRRARVLRSEGRVHQVVPQDGHSEAADGKADPGHRTVICGL